MEKERDVPRFDIQAVVTASAAALLKLIGGHSHVCLAMS